MVGPIILVLESVTGYINMKHKILTTLTLCFLALFISCKKAPLTVGPIVQQSRALPGFTEVYVNDYINLSLVSSDTCYIEITTGENIIDNITTEVNNGSLSIINTTTCNWIRPYDYQCEAVLYFKDITNFIFASSGTLKTKNNYNGQFSSDSHRFEIDGGSGDIDMNVSNCDNLQIIYSYGTSRLNIHGENNRYFKIYKKSYGIIDARDYDADNVVVTTLSASDCYISAGKSIEATINDLGNIYYIGDPESISVTYGEFSKGRLLPLH